MLVIDFQQVPTGTIVRRSRHWMKEHKSWDRKQLGIVTGHETYKDKVRGLVSWPLVHWEGQLFSSLTHPANVAMYRPKAAELVSDRMIEVEG